MILRQIFAHVLLAIHVFALWGATADADGTAKKVALVIGNSDYDYVPNLPNPVNDATDIAAALTRLDFTVTTGIDYDYREMRLALKDFADTAADADIALVYYAGHGIEIDKTNYLIPVNAELKSDRDVDFEAIPLDTVLSAISPTKGLKVVLVDACRNNPFRTRINRTNTTRAIGRGLARIDPGGILVGYAAREGTLALDGEGRNSPYAMALLEHLEKPGLEIGKLFRKVRDTVYTATDGQQEPFTYGSLPGEDIFLSPPIVQAALPQISAQPMSRADASIVADFAKADTEGTLDGWNAFLSLYAAFPDNALVGIAQGKRDKLRDMAELRRREIERQPWLIPQAGTKGYSIELTPRERKLVQKALGYMGFDLGAIDGRFGPKTQRAISTARFQNGLDPGTRIDLNFLKILPNVPAVEALISDTARSFKDDDLPADIEPRLAKAIKVLGSRYIKFNYFRGNLYIAVLAQSYWYSSSQLARKAGGHLVTISDAQENRFVYQLFASDDRFVSETRAAIFGPQIGLNQIDRSHEPAGGWAWVTGEPFVYKNWSPGNPDNYNKGQHTARFYRNKTARNRAAGAIYWDDSSGYSGAFIMEVE